MTDSIEAFELTVVVLTRNRADLVEETLASLAGQKWDGRWDIVFLDNGSTDATPRILRQRLDCMPTPTRIVEATGGQSVPYARNAGAKATTARSVVFVDDDDVLAPGFVAAMGMALRDHEFVGPRHDYHTLNDERTARDRTGQTKGLNHFGGIPVVSGGGFGCRRDLWEQVGGNDESFRAGQDIDFSLRVAALDTITPHFCGDAEYCVRARTTTRGAFRQGKRMGRAAIRLHKVHTAHLRPEPEATRQWMRRWVALVLRLRGLRQTENRPRWAFDVGREVGRLMGMLAHRTWSP